MSAGDLNAAVVGAGLCLPIGDTLAAAHAAWRAGVVGFKRSKQHRSVHDGVPRTVSAVASLDPALSPLERIVALAGAAAGEAWSAAQPAIAGAPEIAIMLILPHPRPDLPADAGAMVDAVLGALPVRAEGREHVVQGQHAAALRAIAALFSEGTVGEPTTLFVVAADSLVAPLLLDHLEAMGVLKTHATPNGFIGGEGAAALLLEPASRADAGTTPRAQLTRVVHGAEERRWYEGHPVMAQALSRAYREALGDDVAEVLWTDVNGEIWRSTEHHLAYLRSGDHHRDPLVMHHPLTQTGDLGAASSLALLALAAHDCLHMRRAQPALVASASFTAPTRAACLVRASHHPASHHPAPHHPAPHHPAHPPS
jgi:3-oxoacyl-[acyl-carrier-protein] synthase-1